MCSGWLKNNSLCLRLQRSSRYCVASRSNGLGLDRQSPDQEDHLQHWKGRMHHELVWILSWHCKLWNNFLIRNSTKMKMMRNLIAVSGTIRVKQYWQPLQKPPLTTTTSARSWAIVSSQSPKNAFWANSVSPLK